MRNYKILALTLVVVFVAAWSSVASDMSRTRNFVPMAVSGNQFEIDSSQLAINKTDNPEIQKIARRLIDDHVKNGRQMKAVLSKNNIVMPSPALTPEHREQLEVLRRAQDFDTKYIEMQKTAHKEAIELYQTYSGDGDNPALRKFTANTLPVLEQHYDMIKGAEVALR